MEWRWEEEKRPAGWRLKPYDEHKELWRGGRVWEESGFFVWIAYRDHCPGGQAATLEEAKARVQQNAPQQAKDYVHPQEKRKTFAQQIAKANLEGQMAAYRKAKHPPSWVEGSVLLKQAWKVGFNKASKVLPETSLTREAEK